MATAEKKRLDQLLVERGLADSRARARALIMAGLVYSGTRRLDKAGVRLAQDARLDVRGRGHPWASPDRSRCGTANCAIKAASARL